MHTTTGHQHGLDWAAHAGGRTVYRTCRKKPSYVNKSCITIVGKKTSFYTLAMLCQYTNQVFRDFKTETSLRKVSL